jgi:hypothetical protein
MRHVRRITPFALLALLAITLASFASIGTAGALLQPFRVSPSSGPPGTVVSVSGTGCTPGPVVAAGADYVKITSTTLPISVDIAVAGNGSWHGQFTVPASPVLGVGLVAATCFSDGVPSSTTYSPQSFTVTAAPTTPPTTRRAVATPAPTPGAAVGGSPGHPTVPDAPAAGAGAGGSGSSGSNAGNGAGTGNTPTAAAAKLATVSGAGQGLAAVSTSGHHRSPWLWWLLAVVVLAIVATSFVNIRRRHDAKVQTEPTAN